MKFPKGTELMVLSYAYYQIKDFDMVLTFFRILQDGELFNIDESNVKKQKMSGAFIQDYPKGHWNYTGLPGEKQVVGGAEISGGILKIDAKAKSALKVLRGIVEQPLEKSIKFQKEEFEDVMEMLKRI